MHARQKLSNTLNGHTVPKLERWWEQVVCKRCLSSSQQTFKTLIEIPFNNGSAGFTQNVSMEGFKFIFLKQKLQARSCTTTYKRLKYILKTQERCNFDFFSGLANERLETVSDVQKIWKHSSSFAKQLK